MEDGIGVLLWLDRGLEEYAGQGVERGENNLYANSCAVLAGNSSSLGVVRVQWVHPPSHPSIHPFQSHSYTGKETPIPPIQQPSTSAGCERRWERVDKVTPSLTTTILTPTLTQTGCSTTQRVPKSLDSLTTPTQTP